MHAAPARPAEDPGLPLHDTAFWSATLGERLQALHAQVLETIPGVDRIACALYEPATRELRTFINSTHQGEALAGYAIPLAHSRSLSELASAGGFRLIDDIPAVVNPDSAHSRWLLDQGYLTSLTVPMYGRDGFIGMVFFNAMRAAAFGPRQQRDLLLYASLINMTVCSELEAMHSVVASAHLARDFAHLRDFETGAHLERMAAYARLIALGVAERYGLSDEFVAHVHLFAPLHDVGKIGIPDAILLKQGRLDAAERAVMESHVAKSCEIASRLIDDFNLAGTPDSRVLMDVVSGHHEFLDGSGYPHALRGGAVPVAARIVAVADIYDALTSRRPYKEAWSQEAAFAELERLVAAGKLDGPCVAALKAGGAELTRIAQRNTDPDVPDLAPLLTPAAGAGS